MLKGVNTVLVPIGHEGFRRGDMAVWTVSVPVYPLSAPTALRTTYTAGACSLLTRHEFNTQLSRCESYQVHAPPTIKVLRLLHHLAVAL